MKSSRRLALAAVACAMVSGSALASSAGGLPPVRHSGSVAYVNGGIGVTEANAMQRASAHWPMSLEFAVRTKHHSEFDADVKAHYDQNSAAFTTPEHVRFEYAILTPDARA